MDCYGEFAKIYDELMGDVDYSMWADYLEGLIRRFSKVEVDSILELACGTGNISIPLAQKGYSVTGVDISQDMLCIASSKSDSQRVGIRLINSDMAEFEYSAVDFQCAICACDGFNYIVNEDTLNGIFKSIYQNLPDGGTLIFDISSYHKIKNMLSDAVFTHLGDDIAYIWENYYDEDSSTIEMDITFFVENENGMYKRSDELHVQRAYRNSEIVGMLKKAGFCTVESLKEFSLEEDDECSERVFFVAVK